jgi:predicted RNA-binding Zn-ribbon protein involved in translation (DUF1610 family)
VASRNIRTERRTSRARQARTPKSPPAPSGKKARLSDCGTRDSDVETLARSIGRIAQQLVDLKDEARALGIFAGDRDLLTCPKCGLMEDVLVDGTLVTYHEENNPKDTGLRFVESTTAKGRFNCPECGSKIVLVAAEPRKRDG